MIRAFFALILWTSAALAAPECEQISFDGSDYTICHIDLARDELRLFLYDEIEQIYGSFSNLSAALKENGETLGFAMNGGMYHADRSPVGLYIEQGVQHQKLITSAGPGNFGLLPNGVLCISQHRVAVIETRKFSQLTPDCVYATQSGPMLVIDGKLHPRFINGGTSRYIRNGVGVTQNGQQAIFAISESPVNFFDFARLFRDRLKTDSALYLDGNISKLHAPSLGRSDGGFPMGPIIGAVSPKN